MAKSAKDGERKFILEVIDIYRELPALWKINAMIIVIAGTGRPLIILSLKSIGSDMKTPQRKM